jgi:quercetin dioxygenase-like cupin family protein
MNQRSVRVVRRDQAHALSVLGATVRFLCEAAHTDSTFSLMEVQLPLDAGPPPHDHDWDEAYFVTAGEVAFTIGGQTVLARAGDFLLAPGGTLHGFRGATADGEARMLIMDAPAHAEGFFKEVARAVKGPEQLPLVPQIGAKHGIRFAPPAVAEAA